MIRRAFQHLTIKQARLARVFSAVPTGAVAKEPILRSDDKGAFERLKEQWATLKKKTKKGDGGGGGGDFDPAYFIGFVALGAVCVALYYQENIREVLGLYPEASYQDFSRLLSSNSIKAVKIIKISEKSGPEYLALITDTNDAKSLLKVGNVDQFIGKIKVRQPDGSVLSQAQTLEFATRHPLTNISLEIAKFAFYIVFISYLGSLIFSTLSKKKAPDAMSGGMSDLMGIGQFSKTRAVKVEGDINVSFKDVAGMEQAKLEIREFVDFLKSPDKYKELGAKIPKGVLLSGPPGTGKTLLAKACAGEAKVNFLYTSGSEFVELFVGIGASRVRDLFKTAKENAPSIIFIDEIDAIGKKRNAGMGSGNDEKNNTLNQILVELDGFGSDDQVVVFAATNRKELLDNALTRTGRFDRSIEVALPTIEERKAIFQVHLKPLKLSADRTTEQYAARLASLSPGFSGSDIANICNEGAILAARKGGKTVTAHDFEMAVERIIGGVEQKKVVNQQERKTVAVHESGHAVVSWFLEGGMPLLKLTIIPRSKGALGFAQYLPNESSLETKEELLDRICSTLGGRVAEKVFFGKVTTGAYDDLQKVYNVAHSLVTKVGMSDEIGLVNHGEHQNGTKRYSNETNRLIDMEIKRIVDECEQKTTQILLEKKELVQKLSDRLLEKETLDLNEIIKVLGPRPFEPKSSFKAFLEEMTKSEEQQAQAAQPAAA